MSLIPWFFAHKYDDLQDCDEVLEELHWQGRRLVYILIFVVGLMYAVTFLAEYGIEEGLLDTFDGITVCTIVGIPVGVLFGACLCLLDMQRALSTRKKEILDSMWDEGHEATGQYRED